MEKDIREQAKNLALKRLNRREYSSQELLRYLMQKGIPSEIGRETLEKLQSLNWVNDERYARIVAREQVNRGKGPRAIRQKLKEKGITLEVNEIRAITEETASLSELEMAKKWIARRYPHANEDLAERNRAIQSLIRRGFSYSIAKEALQFSSDENDLI